MMQSRWLVAVTAVVSTVVSLVAVAPASAKTEQGRSDPVKITYRRGTQFQLAAGGRSRVVDLPDVGGCLEELYDPQTDKRFPGNPTFRVLDETAAGGKWYVLMQSIANAGCNVQGLCGAGNESGLHWLEIDKKTLRVTSRQWQPLVSCFDNWTFETQNAADGETERINMRNGQLDVTVEHSDYERNETTVVRVTYDRTRPRGGFQLTVKRRPL
jgi:hypothetical protein